MAASTTAVEFWRTAKFAGDHDQGFVQQIFALEVSDQGDRRPQWLQGPLDSSELIDIGTYQQLIDRTMTQGETADTIDELTVTIVATYTARDRPVAARRSFDVRRSRHGTRLEPRTYTAEQIRSRAALRSIRAYMQETQ